MRATTDLEKLCAAVQGRIKRLRGRFGNLTHLAPTERSPSIAYCVVELDNLVVSALRQFAISSLSGCRTRSGQRARGVVRFSDEKAIAAYFLSVLNPQKFLNMGSPTLLNRKQEGTIRDPKDIEKVFLQAQLSNMNSLQSALSLNTTLFRDLATFRNFYAHRNDDTWRKAKQKALDLGFANISHLDDAITKPYGVGPATIFDVWLFDAELFFDQAVN